MILPQPTADHLPLVCSTNQKPQHLHGLKSSRTAAFEVCRLLWFLHQLWGFIPSSCWSVRFWKICWRWLLPNCSPHLYEGQSHFWTFYWTGDVIWKIHYPDILLDVSPFLDYVIKKWWRLMLQLSGSRNSDLIVQLLKQMQQKPATEKEI